MPKVSKRKAKASKSAEDYWINYFFALRRAKEYRRHLDLAQQNALIHELCPGYSKALLAPNFRKRFDRWISKQGAAVKTLASLNDQYVANAVAAAVVFMKFVKDTRFKPARARPPARCEIPKPRMSSTRRYRTLLSMAMSNG